MAVFVLLRLDTLRILQLSLPHHPPPDNTAAMERLPQFDEGYHGDTNSQPGSDTGTMTPDPHAGLKTSMLQLPAEVRRGMRRVHFRSAT